MTKSIIPQTNSSQLPLFGIAPFERIKHYDDNGNECWYARELMIELEYTKWNNFARVIEQAKIALSTSGYKPDDHIAEFGNMIQVGKGAQREVIDFKLSRFACYHIAQEGDASKEKVAEAKTYFLIQTRKQELSDDKKNLKRSQDVTAYQIKGKSQDWAEARVDSKTSQQALTKALIATHETHSPDYAAIGGTVNQELFDMTKNEIVEYLGLLPKDAKNYRDHLGRYALVALKEVNYTSAARIKSLKRELTTDEQVSIVRFVVRKVAPLMNELAEYAGQDFVSGAELDSSGKALITRNVKLLKDGK